MSPPSRWLPLPPVGLLDQETWVAVTVPPEFQAIVESLESRAAASEVASSPSRTPASAPHESAANVAVGASTEPRGAAGATESVAKDGWGNILVVGGGRYHLVTTMLSLLRMIEEHVAFQEAVPAFAIETARRVIKLLQVPPPPSSFPNAECIIQRRVLGC